MLLCRSQYKPAWPQTKQPRKTSSVKPLCGYCQRIIVPVYVGVNKHSVVCTCIYQQLSPSPTDN